MFGFMEKKYEKRIFLNYLLQFGITPDGMNPRALRLILESVHHEANVVSRRFHEPLSAVSRNIISEAAWASIFCLLGPTRMIELSPEFRDITDEVEMELIMSCSGEEEDHNIYRQVFAILTDLDLCHEEVMALIQAGAQGLSEFRSFDGDRP